jgi:hypothetical protein
VTLSFKVDLSGPIFTNASGKVQEGIGDVLQAAVEEGEKRLDETLRPRPAGVYLAMGSMGMGDTVCTNKTVSKGNYRHNVHGELLSNQHALITDGGVVYGSWLEGESSRNAATRFKGYAAFRKVKDWLQSNIGDIAAKVNLARRLGG